MSFMIRSFKCKETQALFEGKSPRRFRSIQDASERKLTQLDAAQTLNFLRSPHGNRLEKLSGDRDGQWSIRINGQFVYASFGRIRGLLMLKLLIITEE
jgi:proteic killer suppression protein